MDKFFKFLSKILRNHYMATYRDTGVFCLSITGTENFQYRPLLATMLNYGLYIHKLTFK